MTGRVIRIPDVFRIIINLGRADGVEEGQRFAVYTPSENIVDPTTHEVLGAYRERKATVVARVVADRFTIAAAPKPTIAQNALRAMVGTDPRATHKDPLWGGGQDVPDPSVLPVETRQIEGLPTGNKIRVGDHVEAVRVAAPPEPQDDADDETPLDSKSSDE